MSRLLLRRVRSSTSLKRERRIIIFSFARASGWSFDGRKTRSPITGPGRRGRRLQGEPQEEPAPVSQAVALGGQFSAVEPRQPPRERQADAEPPERAIERVVGLGEEVEDPSQHV